MKFGQLAIDKEYVLTVASTSEGQPFPSTRGGDLMYPHKFVLTDEDNIEYKCQVCDLNETHSYCQLFDEVQIKVKCFTKNIHTIEFIRVDAPKHVDPIKPKEPNKIYNGNPIIGSTAAALSLNAAVLFYQHREETVVDNVLSKADEFFTWLTEKHNTGNPPANQ